MIKYTPISDIFRFKPHEEVSSENVDGIAGNIKRSSTMNAIVVHDGVILDGHHRVEALKKLYDSNDNWKNKKIPVYHLNDFNNSGDYSKDDIMKAANGGVLLPNKSTVISPTSEDDIKEILSTRLIMR